MLRVLATQSTIIVNGMEISSGTGWVDDPRLDDGGMLVVPPDHDDSWRSGQGIPFVVVHQPRLMWPSLCWLL